MLIGLIVTILKPILSFADAHVISAVDFLGNWHISKNTWARLLIFSLRRNGLFREGAWWCEVHVTFQIILNRPFRLFGGVLV